MKGRWSPHRTSGLPVKQVWQGLLPSSPPPVSSRVGWEGAQVGSVRSPVWMMMCLDRSPTFTKALLHTLHLCGRMLSW